MVNGMWLIGHIKELAMTKYQPLKEYLEKNRRPQIPMTFHQIEELIGDKLPSSARKHRPWWSNNPSNSVITHAWLKAGYKATKVNMKEEKLIFELSQELQTEDKDTYHKPKPQEIYQLLLGCMKGSLKIADDANLTQPVKVSWDAEEGRL